MGTEYSDALDYFVGQNRVFIGQNSHSTIVVHGTGGPPTWTAQQLGDYFRTTPAKTSSHFGIDRAGVVCQYVSLHDGAAANCCLETGHDPFWDQFNGDNLNLHTISIEHVNDETNSLPLTPAQQAASFKLVAWLCHRYGLGPDQIKTHASIDPASRARCPGPAFPLDALTSYLGETMNNYGPNSADFNNYFTVNPDGNWTCTKTNAVVMGGNLALFQTLSVDGESLPIIGLPLENEQYHTLFDGYQWSSQRFERATINFDPVHKIDSAPGMGTSYLAHVNPSQDTSQIPQNVRSAAIAANNATIQVLKTMGM